MKSFIQSEWVRLIHRKKFFWTLLCYLGFLLYLMVNTSESTKTMQYRLFSTITILYLTFLQLLSISERYERKIIRYYLESTPNRYHLICYDYLEYIGLYILFNLIFFLPQLFNRYSMMSNILIYLIIYCLYLTINMNIIIYFEKTGVVIILSLLLLWIAPNLINLLFVNTVVYPVQIFYYLSPDSFGTLSSMFNIILPLVYIILLFSLSIVQFVRKEY